MKIFLFEMRWALGLGFIACLGMTHGFAAAATRDTNFFPIMAWNTYVRKNILMLKSKTALISCAPANN